MVKQRIILFSIYFQLCLDLLFSVGLFFEDTDMSKFNNTKLNKQKTVNLAGGKAYKQSPEMELLSWVTTSFVENKFYESTDKQLNRVKALINTVDPVFVAKLAIYARDTFGMRSSSHVLAGELAEKASGTKWGKSFYEKVVVRPDDITEILSYRLATRPKNKAVTNAMKKGLGMSLSKMNGYKLGKYKANGKSVSLVDAINLLHPKHTFAIKDLVEGTLEPPETWEVMLSEAGKADNPKHAKEKVWESLILENKLGYFALLRNLNNIAKQCPKMIDEVCEMLTDENRIKRSRLFPFRYQTAIDNLKTNDRRIIVALQRAMDISLSNVPKFNGKTLIVVDTSGSMTSGRVQTPIKTASLFASALYKTNDADLMQFSTSSEYMVLNPLDSVHTLSTNIQQRAFGGGTNFNSIFEKASQKYDRVIILSDMQAWGSSYSFERTMKEYMSKFNCKPFVYSFDLNGYGTLQLKESGVFCLSGFSDKVFSVMNMLESDKDAMLNEVNKIEI